MRHTRISLQIATHTQKGFSLLFSLIIMMVIAAMVMAGSRASNQEKRLAANDADRKYALSIAERALRIAETSSGEEFGEVIKFQDGVNSLTELLNVDLAREGGKASIKFSDDCANGLCTPSIVLDGIPYGTSIPAWERANVFSGKTTNSKAIDTIGQNIASQNPRYIIEILGLDTSRNFNQDANLIKLRITVRAWGKNANTQVTLQSIVQISV